MHDIDRRADLAAPSAPAEVEGLAERHQDKARNRIINLASIDLERIINGHDPEVYHLGNRVWDHLDKMALEIESHHATTLAALQARAEKAEAERDELLAAIGDWARPTGANGMTMPSDQHPLMIARVKILEGKA